MFCPSPLLCVGIRRLIELPRLETFPGAARLPTHRGARLQSGLADVASRSFRRRGEVWRPSRRSGRSTRCGFASLLCALYFIRPSLGSSVVETSVLTSGWSLGLFL